MPKFPSGLILTPNLSAENVTSLEMTFDNSVGIMAKKIDVLGLNVRSFRDPLKRAIRDVVIPSIAMNFQKFGRPRWPNLSPDTEAKRLSEGSGWAILDRTGKLKKTMRRMDIWHIDKEKALLANLPDDVFYGGIHQSGASGGKKSFSVSIDPGVHRKTGKTLSVAGEEAGDGDIPQRRFVMLQPEDEQAIDRIFNEWLGERIAAAGLRAADTRGGL